MTNLGTKRWTWTCPNCQTANAGSVEPGGDDWCLGCGALVAVPAGARLVEASKQPAPAPTRGPEPKTQALAPPEALPLADFPGRMDGGSHKAITPERAAHLIAWASERGLDAWSGHAIYLYGQPYCTIKGLLHLARSRKVLKAYSWHTLSAEEKGNNGYKAEDWVVEVQATLAGFDAPIRELGVVPVGEVEVARQNIRANLLADYPALAKDEERLQRELARKELMLPLVRDPRGMAEKRGLALVLQRGMGLESTEIEPLQP